MRRAERHGVFGPEFAGQIGFHIGQFVKSGEAVVGHALIGGHARQAGLGAHPPAERLARLGEGNRIAALPQRPRAFKAGRATADNEYGVAGHGWRDAFGMPALTPLFAHSRVLCAADRRIGHIARYADIAADALADILNPPFFDFFG